MKTSFWLKHDCIRVTHGSQYVGTIRLRKFGGTETLQWKTFDESMSWERVEKMLQRSPMVAIRRAAEQGHVFAKKVIAHYEGKRILHMAYGEFLCKTKDRQGEWRIGYEGSSLVLALTQPGGYFPIQTLVDSETNKPYAFGSKHEAKLYLTEVGWA